MNVAHLLVGQAKLRPQAPAIIESSGRQRKITFAELEDRSSRCGQFLRDSGIVEKDHVLVFVPMSIDLYVALIAIFQIGAVATFLDPLVGVDHIDRCCRRVKPTALIATSKAHLLRLRSGALRQIPHQFSVGWPVPGAVRWSIAIHHPKRSEIVDRAPDDPALLTFTSGSTGLPKAAVRSHGFLAAQHASLQKAIALVAGEIDLATLPIFSLANLASGVTTLIPDADLRRPGLVNPRPILRQIREVGVTRSVASPAFFERLLEVPKAPEWLKSVRHIYTGGAPVFPGLLQRLREAAPAAHIAAVYGSTEAEPIAHIGLHEITQADTVAMLKGAGLLAGVPVSDIDLRIIPNQDGRPMQPMTRVEFDQSTLAHNQIGEIIVRGRHVLTGYLQGVGDEETKLRVDDDVWHRTGDAGYLDAQGRLWLLGRAQARIIDVDGEIYPFAVECAVSQMKGVRRSALIQYQSQRTLVVELSADGDQALVIREIKEKLASAKLLQVLFVRKIPVDKRHNAKIDYPQLQKLLG